MNIQFKEFIPGTAYDSMFNKIKNFCQIIQQIKLDISPTFNYMGDFFSDLMGSRFRKGTKPPSLVNSGELLLVFNAFKY